jgi:hypothetical protein
MEDQMQKTASYFVSGYRAYRSEIALFRQEGITAESSIVVKAPANLNELFILEGARGGVTVWGDGLNGLKATQKRGTCRLFSVTVMERVADTRRTQTARPSDVSR